MSNKTKILIVGGSFGGVYTALRLDKTLARRADVEVTLVSRDNFLLFTPMLHEVASGDLNPSDIVNPIRRMLKRVQFVQADVRSIDLAAKQVHCTRDLRPLPVDLDYDHLVLAARATRGPCRPRPLRRGCDARTRRKARPLRAAEAGRTRRGGPRGAEGDRLCQLARRGLTRRSVPGGHAHLDCGGDAQPRGRAAAVQEGEGAGSGRRVLGGAGFRGPLGDG